MQWLSIVAGLVAALLWFWSARVRMPVLIERIDGGDFSDGKEADDDLDRLTKGLARQGNLSALAAGFTALSILFQVLSSFRGIST